MRVYHSPGSRSTRVLWTLEEAGVPYDVTVLTLEERRGTEHRRLHPLGRVPVIELDDGQLMFESAAICLHLGDLFPESGLVPHLGSAERPQVLQWVLFAMTEVEPAVGRWSRARREHRDDTEERERFDERASVLSTAIGDGPWLLGDRFTVADIVLSRMLNVVSDELAGFYPELELHAYRERAFARDAHQRANAVGRP
jgi:glutathione S-transferase